VELGQEVDTSKEHHRCGKQPVVSLWMVGSFCFAQLEELFPHQAVERVLADHIQDAAINAVALMLLK